MGDLVERLTVQADVGLFGMPDYLEIVSYQECLAEITRLRAALADAQTVGFAAGVEAVAKEIEGDDYNIGRAMSMAICCSGHECGCMGASVRDYLVYNIRALTPTDATAAAARVLLPGMEQRHIDHMTSLDRDPEKYTSEYRMAAKALRAIAGDTP